MIKIKFWTIDGPSKRLMIFATHKRKFFSNIDKFPETLVFSKKTRIAHSFCGNYICEDHLKKSICNSSQSL